jgi:cobalt/nickel transport system permease protein
MPHIVLELMLITYRFIFLLYDTAQGIRIAQRGRGGHVGFVRTLRDIAMLFTRLFSKTMERYRGLAQGLVSRGFDSQIHLAPYQSGSVGWRYGLESGIGIVLLLVMESLLYWKGG